ncbi:MAG: ABC transporter ATP-binding protein [Candidatus Aureabacteria bacterium]|nr:ABC transporter ATP-binding protein [Candidatus Auribacterota bacterium]
MALLEVRDITAGYGEVQILWGVTLRLEAGKLTALVGSNGVGKTTLLRTVMGLLPAWGGAVRFRGREINSLPTHARACGGLTLVPEGRQLFTGMSVLENLQMGAFTTRARASMQRNLEKVFDLFPRLRERRGQKAGTLSGGEQQMLAVARGLMADPEILMCDELSLGLAPALVLELFGTIRRLKGEGLTMLMVEQNVRMALAVSDYAYVMSEGRVSMEGNARELAERDDIRRAYLGA